MKNIVAVLLCGFVVTSCSTELEVSSLLEGKIENGSRDKYLTYVAEVVHVIATVMPRRICMAIVVTDKHVLATAYCISHHEVSCNKDKTTTQRLISYLSVFVKRRMVNIESIRTHQKYRPKNPSSYNIGIITLDQKVRTNSVHLPLIGYIKQIHIQDGRELTLVGMDDDYAYSKIKLVIDLKTVYCRERFHGFSQNRLLCAYPKNINEVVTKADIGSPLLDNKVIVGIYIGRLKHVDEGPLVFTYIFDHLNFLSQEITVHYQGDPNSVGKEYHRKYLEMHRPAKAGDTDYNSSRSGDSHEDFIIRKTNNREDGHSTLLRYRKNSRGQHDLY